MMQLLCSIKTCAALLLGVSVLFPAESVGDSTPGTGSLINSTAELYETTEPVGGGHLDTATLHPAGEISVYTAAATAQEAAVPSTVESKVPVTGMSDPSTADLVAGTTEEATTTVSHEKAKPTEEWLHRQYPASSGMPSTTTSSASVAPIAVTMFQPTPETEVTSNSSSTASPADSSLAANISTRNLSDPSTAFTTTTTSEMMPTLEPTSSSPPSSPPVTLSEPPSTTKSINISSTLQPASTTAMSSVSTLDFGDEKGSNSTAEPSTTSFSTDAGVFSTTSPTGNSTIIPLVPKKKAPIPTNTSTQAPHREVSTIPSVTEDQQCSASKRGLIGKCLIAVASLAGLATLFMVTTIVLCAKLSTRRYKVNKRQPDTEMMCISSLLPETNYSCYTRQHNPVVTNGVLVMHARAAMQDDDDEDGGDNLTLSSFLPDNDRHSRWDYE